MFSCSCCSWIVFSCGYMEALFTSQICHPVGSFFTGKRGKATQTKHLCWINGQPSHLKLSQHFGTRDAKCWAFLGEAVYLQAAERSQGKILSTPTHPWTLTPRTLIKELSRYISQNGWSFAKKGMPNQTRGRKGAVCWQDNNAEMSHLPALMGARGED